MDQPEEVAGKAAKRRAGLPRRPTKRGQPTTTTTLTSTSTTTTTTTTITTTITAATATTTLATEQKQQSVCAGCLKPIRERYLLEAMGKRWHEDCLKCAGCECRLGEVGSSLFTHDERLWCRRDFLRIYGQPGLCSVCKAKIQPYELVMKANKLAYHMDCFACQQCRYRFCVGDGFYLADAERVVCVVCHSDGQQQPQQPQQQPTSPSPSLTADAK